MIAQQNRCPRSTRLSDLGRVNAVWRAFKPLPESAALPRVASLLFALETPPGPTRSSGMHKRSQRHVCEHRRHPWPHGSLRKSASLPRLRAVLPIALPLNLVPLKLLIAGARQSLQAVIGFRSHVTR